MNKRKGAAYLLVRAVEALERIAAATETLAELHPASPPTSAEVAARRANPPPRTVLR